MKQLFIGRWQDGYQNQQNKQQNRPAILIILNVNHLMDWNKNAGKQSLDSYEQVGQIWVR